MRHAPPTSGIVLHPVAIPVQLMTGLAASAADRLLILLTVTSGRPLDQLVRGLATLFPRAELANGDSRFEATVASVCRLVDDARAPGDAHAHLPLDIRGTAFQEQVWRSLRGIPAGRTMSYAEVAATLGRPRSHRAVANACAANPVALLIPCHRVVRSDGRPGGYRWGLERKQALLGREAEAEVEVEARSEADVTTNRSRPCTDN